MQCWQLCCSRQEADFSALSECCAAECLSWWLSPVPLVSQGRQCLGVTVLHSAKSWRSSSPSVLGPMQQGQALKHTIKEGHDHSCCGPSLRNIPLLLQFFFFSCHYNSALKTRWKTFSGQFRAQMSVTYAYMCYICRDIDIYTTTAWIPGHSLPAVHYSYKTERRVWSGSKIKEKP